MLEDLNDVISMLVVTGFVIAGIIVFFIANNRHHDARVKKSDQRFQEMLDDMDDAYDDEKDGPFYG